MSMSQEVRNRFCFAEHASLIRAETGWLVQTLVGETSTMSETEFARRAFAVDCTYGDNGFYAILDGMREHCSFGYEVDAQSGLVWPENADEPIEIAEFLMSAVRADKNGMPVCSFLSSAEDQLHACRVSGGAEGHVTEIIEGTTAFGASLVGGMLHVCPQDMIGIDNADYIGMVA